MLKDLICQCANGFDYFKDSSTIAPSSIAPAEMIFVRFQGGHRKIEESSAKDVEAGGNDLLEAASEFAAQEL